MANAAGDAHEYPIYGAHFRVTFPILDADGDFVSGATGLDSEVSIDCGTFADCTNEATEIATSSGMYYLDITGAEMTGKVITVQVKTSSSGAKTTPITLYPRRLKSIANGTAQAGAASTITLAASTIVKDGSLDGCFVLITNNGAAGSQYQARRIIGSVNSTQVATVDSAWGTNPSSASTYDILPPETVNLAGWAGLALASVNTNGLPDVNATKMSGTSLTGRDIGASVLLSAGSGTGQLDFTSGVVKGNVTQLLGTAWLTPGTAGTPDVNVKLWNGLTTVALPLVPTTAGRTLDVSAGGEAGLDWANIGTPSTTVSLSGTTVSVVSSVTGNVGGNVVGSVASVTGSVGSIGSGGITAASIAADAITAAKIADGAIDTATFASGTTIPRVTLADTLTTYTGNTVQTGDSFARIGAAGVGLTNIVLPSGGLANVTTWTVALTGNITGNLSGSVGSIASGGIAAASFASNAITAAALAADAGVEIASAVWQDAVAGDFTVAGSVGKSLGGAFTALGTPVFTTASLVNAPGGGGSSLTQQDVRDAMYLSPTAGTIHTNSVDAKLDKIVFKTANISAGSVEVTSPVDVNVPSITVVKGDDYNVDDGRGLTFTNSGWPDLTGATVKLRVAGATADVSMTVDDESTVTASLTAAYTGQFTANTVQDFSVVATLADGHIVTLAEGLTQNNKAGFYVVPQVPSAS